MGDEQEDMVMDRGLVQPLLEVEGAEGDAGGAQRPCDQLLGLQGPAGRRHAARRRMALLAER